MKKTISFGIWTVASLSLCASLAWAAPTAQDHADARAINTACAADAQTAGCGAEKVGRGLLKCLHIYRRAQRQTNKAFTFSPGCESAIQQLHADKAAGK
jgi:hypothetical protein